MTDFQTKNLVNFLQKRGIKTSYTPSPIVGLAPKEQFIMGHFKDYSDFKKWFNRFKKRGENFGSRGASYKRNKALKTLNKLEKNAKKYNDSEVISLIKEIRRKIDNVPKNEKTIITFFEPLESKEGMHIGTRSGILLHELVHDWIKKNRPNLKINIAGKMEEGLAEYIMLKSTYPYLPISESARTMPMFKAGNKDYIENYYNTARIWEDILEKQKLPLNAVLKQIEKGKLKILTKSYREKTLLENIKSFINKFRK